mgnify:CR=1 FL=1
MPGLSIWRLSMLNSDIEFCPVPDSVKPLFCRLVEGQLVSVSNPCPHRGLCQLDMLDLAAAYATVVDSTGTLDLE